jgi:hypothetical protein
VAEDDRGRRARASHTWYSGRTPIQRDTLKPGEAAVFKSSALAFVGRGIKAPGHPVGHRIPASPGGHTIRFTLRFPDMSSSGPKGLPRPTDWQGTLETGKTKLRVVGREEPPKAKGARPDARVEAAGKVPWGQAVEGARIRLRADRRVWKAGEEATFKVDIRNGAKSTLHDNRGRYTIYNLELDGHWYLNGARVRKAAFVIPPSGLREGLPVLPLDGKYWQSASSLPRKPQLRPGKHTVRVAFVGALGAVRAGAGRKPIRLESNPVEIEVLPADKAPATKPA